VLDEMIVAGSVALLSEAELTQLLPHSMASKRGDWGVVAIDGRRMLWLRTVHPNAHPTARGGSFKEQWDEFIKDYYPSLACEFCGQSPISG
jgi:hypothetical protein